METKPIELTTCDLPKRLAVFLARHDELQRYMTDVCRKEKLPFVRLTVDQCSSLREWCNRKLSVYPEPLTYRGRPVISEREPAPAFELSAPLSA